jgi:MFS family permease
MRDRLHSLLSRFTSGLPRIFWLLWIGTFINRLGSFVVPFFTLYLTSQRGLPVRQAALMVSLFGTGSFTAALVGGELADRWGRRPVLLISFIIAPANMILLGLARPLLLIAPLTFLQGFFTDLYRPAVSAMVADLVPPEGRPRAYGYLCWAVSLGFAFAPAIAGFMARWNYFLLFLGDALTTFIFGMIVLWGVAETRPARAKEARETRGEGQLRRLWQEPLMLVFAALALGFGIVYMQGYVTLPVDMRALGLGPEAYGLAIAVSGVLVFLLAIPASHLLGHCSRFGSMALAGILLGTGYGLVAFAASLGVRPVGCSVDPGGDRGLNRGPRGCRESLAGGPSRPVPGRLRGSLGYVSVPGPVPWRMGLPAAWWARPLGRMLCLELSDCARVAGHVEVSPAAPG